MGKSKFTSGPWEWDVSGAINLLVTIEPKRKCVLEAFAQMRVADAVLIAAAPDLYEAIEKILKRAESSWRLEEHLKFDGLYQPAEAALAKARG